MSLRITLASHSNCDTDSATPLRLKLWPSGLRVVMRSLVRPPDASRSTLGSSPPRATSIAAPEARSAFRRAPTSGLVASAFCAAPRSASRPFVAVPPVCARAMQAQNAASATRVIFRLCCMSRLA
jgi:hypothetical protein